MKQARVLLGVTGSVAATLTPKIFEALIAVGHDVRIIATESSLYFWNPLKLPRNHSDCFFTDEDEWPSPKYVKDQEIPHITLGDWADVLVIAPLSANTLAKMAFGFCDNLLTSTVRAWPTHQPMVLAPAMNTRMWLNSLTENHITKVKLHYPNVFVVEPEVKHLACGDHGVGAMAHIDDIVARVDSL